MNNFLMRYALFWCLVVTATAAAWGRTYTGTVADAQQRPHIMGDYNNVALVQDDFEYTKEYLDANFTYSYEDEQGRIVEVPISTPATTRNAMIALMKKVYTDKRLPGRKWVYRDVQRDASRRILGFDGTPLNIGGQTFTDEAAAIAAVEAAGLSVDATIDYRNEYVDYTVLPDDPAVTYLGVAPGDYTPLYEGETCLIAEGVDDNNPAGTGLASLDRLKSLTLMTSRYALPDNVDKYGQPNPGFGFNIEKPLHKFFLLSKGKARATDFAPVYGLFEEFSANEQSAWLPGGIDNVYDALKQGTGFYVHHDCSSVVLNTGHYMVMGTVASAAAADISLSIFIPFYRSYDDRVDHPNEKFAWYDPAHRPYLYYYAIDLQAEARLADTEPGEPEEMDVVMTWQTNFRTNLYTTPAMGEFWVYKVVGNVVDYANPVAFSSVLQPERLLTQVPNPDYDGSDPSVDPYIPLATHLQYMQQVVIDPTDPTRVLSNFDDAPTVVSYREPVGDIGRYETYVVTGRPEGYRKAPTQSNVMRVYIPGRYELSTHTFEIGVDGVGTSTFSLEQGTNGYDNAIVLSNRPGSLAVTGGDVQVGDRFEIWRSERCGGVESAPAKIAELLIATESGHKEQTNNCIVADGVVTLTQYLGVTLYDADGNVVDNMLRWKTTASRPGDAIDPGYKGPYSFSPLVWHQPKDPEYHATVVLPDGSSKLAILSDVFNASISANSHPEAYVYQMVYHPLEGEPVWGNKAELEVFKSAVNIVPAMHTFSEVLADEVALSLDSKALDLELDLTTDPEVKYYRLVMPRDLDPVAVVQNNFGRITASVVTGSDKGEAIYALSGDVVDAKACERVLLPVSLRGLAPSLASRIAGGELPVAVALAPRRDVEGLPSKVDPADPYSIYNSYGAPTASVAEAPALTVTDAAIHPFTPMQGVKSTRVTTITLATCLPDLGDTYTAAGVTHYAAWKRNRSTDLFEPMLGHADYNSRQGDVANLTGTTIGLTEAGNYMHMIYADKTHNEMEFWLGNTDSETTAEWLVRAYVPVVATAAAVSSAPAMRAPAAVTPTAGYMVAEALVNVAYDDKFVTALDGPEAAPAGDGPAVYYDLRGVRVDNPESGAIYIEVTPQGARKIKI